MRNANIAGENQITIAQLIKAALRSRPDRIIVGEVRGEEALSMLNAMNTGHDGSISTGHSNGPEDMLRRLETMVLMGVEMPVSAIRGQIASAIDIIIHLGRVRDGSRKLMEIDEVLGICDGQVKLAKLFIFDQKKGSVLPNHFTIRKNLGSMVSMKLIKNYYLSRIKEVNILEAFNIRKAVLKAAQGMILFFIICYLFYDRIWLGILYAVFCFPYMLYQAREERKMRIRQSRLEFKEMLLSVYNSLSAGYSLENAVRAARDDMRAVNGDKKSVLEQETRWCARDWR